MTVIDAKYSDAVLLVRACPAGEAR